MIETAICGQGRLGGRIAALLSATGKVPLPLRLHPEHGLVLPVAQPPLHIRTLIICLVPRAAVVGQAPAADDLAAENQASAKPQRASVAWAGLLDGVLAQVQRGELIIDQLLHVSSTAVYEGYQQGWVRATSPAKGDSPRALALAEAEQKVRGLSRNSLVVRLSGLYGPGYEGYQPLTFNDDKARMGVDLRAAAAMIYALLRKGITGAATALITDGNIYYQGQAYKADVANPLLAKLASKQRLLLASHPLSWPPRG